MNRLAIFDCDGTLVDSQATICMAMEDCFVRAKLDPPSRSATRRVVGLSLVEAMQAMLPAAEPDFHRALAEDYKRSFVRLREQGMADEPLYEGVTDMLEALDDAGWLLGIATGKSDRGLLHCLEAHGIRRRFVSLQTSDRHPSKPHPSMIFAALAEADAAPEQSMMIGDTSYDMAMAVDVRVAAIGVTWGYHDAQDLLDAGAHHIAQQPSDIASLARMNL